jgi:hypothetical protein
MERKESDRDIFVGDKYFYPIRGTACLSACKVRGEGMRIGSFSCKNCEHILEHDDGENWIRCSRIEEALGEFSLPVINRKMQIAQGIN